METTRMPLVPYRRLTTLAMLVLAACGGSTVTDTPDPITPVDTTKPGPTVQRASITARVTIDPADATLAQQAGIGVTGLTVRLTSSRAGEPVRTAITGADGAARFDNLLEASYSASVERKLTTEELAKLSPSDREASVFAGGGQVVLSPPTGRSVDLALVAARRGSIVISEIFAYYGPPERGFDNYVYGSYMEVFNNSDTTAYLDGILYVITSPNYHRLSSQDGTSCDALPKSLRLDSTALYTGVIRAFPGSGRDFPIRPGEAKVVAMDAINHASAAPVFRQLDLSRADFEEFWTDGDVDNPFAVNIVRVYGSTAGVFGRGFGFMVGAQELALVAPEARSYMTQVTVPDWSAAGWGTWTVTRIPSEYILDFVGIERATPPIGDNGYCAPWTSAKYDRAPAPLSDFLVRQAITRRSLGRGPGGNEILQRTKNSARDFMLAEPLKRSLDK